MFTLCRIFSFFLSLFILPFASFTKDTDMLEAWGRFGRADNVYSDANTDEKVIALTFDDGPHPLYTPKILDILKKHNAKATFFVIGRNAEIYEALTKRIYDEGHELGNHTYSHLTSKDGNSNSLNKELVKTGEIIKRITSSPPTLFRPPTGYCNNTTVRCASKLNYKIIVWTIDTRDWAHNSVDNIVNTVLKQAKSGSIILMHDYITKPSPTPEALEIILSRLTEKGYSFVTVSELIDYEN